MVGPIDTGGRVCDFPSTDETFTLDDTVVLNIAEGTLEGQRARLNIDTAADVTDRGKRRVVKGTCPIDRSTDSGDLIESADGGEGRVVGNKECSADGGEFWK